MYAEGRPFPYSIGECLQRILPSSSFEQAYTSKLQLFTMLSDETTRYFIVIESAFVIITLGLALWSYIREVAEQRGREDLGRSCCDERQMGYFVAHPPGRLRYFFGHFVSPPPRTLRYLFRKATTRVPEVPTIENLIQAGDRLLFTSSMFDHIPSSPNEVCWVSLYTQFFQGMAWLSEEQTRDARKNEDVKKYLEKSDDRIKYLLKTSNDLAKPLRSILEPSRTAPDVEIGAASEPAIHTIFKPKSKSPVRHCLFPGKSKGPATLVKCLLPLEKSRPTQQTKCETLDLPDIRSLWLVEGKPCIEMSREELAALALALGVPLTKHADGSISGTGPFGTHLSLVRHINHWRLRITHQHRQFDHEAQYGSGYSTVFAKHMACSCIPLDLDNSIKDTSRYENQWKDKKAVKGMDTVRTIHVDPVFVNWIRGDKFAQAVTNLERLPAHEQIPEDNLAPLQEAVRTCQMLKYLYRLPGAYKTDAYCCVPEQEGENSRYVLHWFNAVAKIAFGGLVPQASKFLINAVFFTVTGEYREDCEDKETEKSTTPVACSQMSANQVHPKNSSSPLTNALQRLIDALHNDCHECHEFKLFGEYVHRRARRESKWLDTDCSIPSTPRHAGALFSRYMTALERLAAKSFLQSHKPRAADPEGKDNATHAVSTTSSASWKPQSYEDHGKPEGPGLMERGVAIATRFIQGNETETQTTEDEAQSYVKRIYERCAQQLFTNFGNEKNAANLVRDVNNVTYKVEKEKVLIEEKCRRITVEDCANVARCIIASWALRVPFIELEWEASDPDAKMAAFDELPSVIAFS
jgi:hypothetical protein